MASHRRAAHTVMEIIDRQAFIAPDAIQKLVPSTFAAMSNGCSAAQVFIG